MLAILPFPSIRISPLTFNFCEGSSVPIPILPSLATIVVSMNEAVDTPLVTSEAVCSKVLIVLAIKFLYQKEYL